MLMTCLSRIYRPEPSVLCRIGTSGVQSNVGASNAKISNDGRFVVFQSDSSNLVPETPLLARAVRIVFVKDLATGGIQIVSRNADWVAYVPPARTDISADGRFVLFETVVLETGCLATK